MIAWGISHFTTLRQRYDIIIIGTWALNTAFRRSKGMRYPIGKSGRFYCDLPVRFTL